MNVFKLFVLVFVMSGCKTTDFKYDFHQGMVTSNTKLLQDSIRNGANVDGDKDQKSTPLIHAIVTSKLDLVRILLENGANPNLGDIKGITPLHFAAYNEDIEAVKLLLTYKADVNKFSKDTDGVPIQGAILKGNIEITKQLINAGADVNITSSETGNFPLQDAVENGHIEIAELLVKGGADVNKVLRTFKEKDANLLLRTIDLEQEHLTKLLVNNGANVNFTFNIKNDEKWSLLFFTAVKKHNFLKLLMNSPVNVNIQNSDGMSTLHYAVMSNNYYMAEDLIKKGADCNLQNNKSETPLDIARQDKLGGIILLLESCNIKT